MQRVHPERSRRVLAICDPGGVSEFYRTLTPYRLLAEAGAIELTIDEGHNPAVIAGLDQFNAVVFSRPDSAEHSLILAEAKRRGLRVVVDVDDNLFLLPPSINAYAAWHQLGSGAITARLWYHKYCIKAADVLTVSTEALGRQLCAGEPLRLREEYLVLKNQVLAAEWDAEESIGPDDQQLKKSPGQVWVGWWGIYNHWDDWRDIAPHVEPVIAARPEVQLVLLGMPELAHLFPRLRVSGQLILGAFAPSDQLAPYRALVRQFDLALAPTADNRFNEAKRDLKVLQYGAAGVPVIASPVSYAAWERYVCLPESPADWGAYLASALINLEEWSRGGRELQKKVLAERTYEDNYERWLEALE